jgi:hypothetical protein
VHPGARDLDNAGYGPRTSVELVGFPQLIAIQLDHISRQEVR